MQRMKKPGNVLQENADIKSIFEWMGNRAGATQREDWDRTETDRRINERANEDKGKAARVKAAEVERWTLAEADRERQRIANEPTAYQIQEAQRQREANDPWRNGDPNYVGC
jgi:hypothetical protein